MISKKMANNETLSLVTESDVFEPRVKSEVEPNRKNSKENTSEGVSIVWKNLRVTAEIKKHHIFRNATRSYKNIIHNVNGYVDPSSLVAILGASGSGKSTFMSALANRQSGDLKVDGDIRMNGAKLQLKLMREISGFVYQDELFIPSLTVFEHMNFAAKLKLDKNLSVEHRKKLIDELIRDVGLTRCAKNFIGSIHYGQEKMILSGGERKRLSVATELLTEPPLLFCDEPTTGLDSFTSLKLIKTMRNMANRRSTTIICSVHQPNEQILDLFHQIILLYKGRIAFSGTTAEALAFFQSVGCNYNEEQNPANYLIECLAIVPGRVSETSTKSSNICTEFEKSHYSKIIHDRIEAEKHKTDQGLNCIRKTERISWFYILYLLAHRELLVSLRDPASKRIELIKKMVTATIIGICMMGTVTMTQEGIQSLEGVLFYMLSENWVATVYYIFAHFSNKMPVFFREYANNVNTPMLFYLSNFISLIPMLSLCPILNVTVMYFLANLRHSWTVFWWTVVFNILVNYTSAALGMLMSLSTNTIDEATMIFYPISIIYLMYFGIYANLRSISWAVSWIRYTSWITYAMESLLALQLNGVDHIECSENLNMPCLKTGEEVLKYLDFDGNTFTTNIVMISVIFLGFLTLGYFAFKIKLYFKLKR